MSEKKPLLPKIFENVMKQGETLSKKFQQTFRKSVMGSNRSSDQEKNQNEEDLKHWELVLTRNAKLDFLNRLCSPSQKEELRTIFHNDEEPNNRPISSYFLYQNDELDTLENLNTDDTSDSYFSLEEMRSNLDNSKRMLTLLQSVLKSDESAINFTTYQELEKDIAFVQKVISYQDLVYTERKKLASQPFSVTRFAGPYIRRVIDSYFTYVTNRDLLPIIDEIKALLNEDEIIVPAEFFPTVEELIEATGYANKYDEIFGTVKRLLLELKKASLDYKQKKHQN